MFGVAVGHMEPNENRNAGPFHVYVASGPQLLWQPSYDRLQLPGAAVQFGHDHLNWRDAASVVLSYPGELLFVSSSTKSYGTLTSMPSNVISLV